MASSKVILLNFSLSKESHLLFQQQVLVSETIKTINYCSQIFYHSLNVKDNSLPERGKYKLKTLFLIYLLFFPCPTSGEARRQLFFNCTTQVLTFVYLKCLGAAEDGKKRIYFRNKSEIIILMCHADGWVKIVRKLYIKQNTEKQIYFHLDFH